MVPGEVISIARKSEIEAAWDEHEAQQQVEMTDPLDRLSEEIGSKAVSSEAVFVPHPLGSKSKYVDNNEQHYARRQEAARRRFVRQVRDREFIRSQLAEADHSAEEQLA